MKNRYSMLPERNMCAAIPLTTIGVNEVAWREKDAIDLVIYLASVNYPVLGGDVYQIKEGRIVHTLDSWYINTGVESIDCYQQSISYIQKYESSNTGGFLYSVIFRVS